MTIVQTITAIKLFIGLTIISFLFACNESPRDIVTVDYSGRVFNEKPKEKDPSFIPSNKDISQFERQVNLDLSTLIDKSSDSLIKKDKQKILYELKKYKRRYYGVTTIENNKMLIVDFLHPDSFSYTNQWRDSLWAPSQNNFMFFTLHYYPNDKNLWSMTF